METKNKDLVNQYFEHFNNHDWEKMAEMYTETSEFISNGTAPDGSEFELPICTVFTIENGQITHDFTYYDNSE